MPTVQRGYSGLYVHKLTQCPQVENDLFQLYIRVGMVCQTDIRCVLHYPHGTDKSNINTMSELKSVYYQLYRHLLSNCHQCFINGDSLMLGIKCQLPVHRTAIHTRVMTSLWHAQTSVHRNRPSQSGLFTAKVCVLYLNMPGMYTLQWVVYFRVNVWLLYKGIMFQCQCLWSLFLIHSIIIVIQHL